MALSAQEQDSLFSQFYELDEIVIQTIKQDKSLKELPVSVSRIAGGAIKNRQLITTKDLNAFIPNLFIPDYGSKYTSPVYIRGIGSKAGAPSVGLYVDGIPFFEKSAFDFDLSEIESVDVYRGPQGTLYGRNTMAGLIYITTCSPLKHEQTHVGIVGGMYNQYIFTGSHYGKVSDTFGYSISGKYQRNGGYFDNTYKDEKADDGQSGNVRLRMDWMIQPNLKFSVTSIYDRSIQGANAYGRYDAETKSVGDIAFNGTSYYHRTLSSTGVGLNYKKDNLHISYQQSLQYLKDKLRQDQDFTIEDKVNSLIGQDQWVTSGELTVKDKIGEHYQGLVGLFGFYQKVDKDVTTYYRKFDSYKQDELPTTGLAVYHQSVIEDLGVKGLSLTLGLRYDYERATRDYLAWKENKAEREKSPINEQHGAETIVRADASNSKEAPVHSKESFNQLLPKAILQYTFPSTGQLYTSVTKGYKTGGFNTSFNHESEKFFGPESSWNYEIGAKHPFWNKRFNAEVAFFWIDWTNQHVQQKVDAGGFMIRNAGKSVSKGIEVSFQGNPFNGFLFSFNYGYTHATFKKYAPSEQLDYAGNYIPMVPRHTMSGSVSYSRPVRHLFFDRYQVGMNVAGNGKTYWHENNQDEQSFYLLLNASASISWKKVTLGIWAKNLTNTGYISYLFKASAGTFAQEGKPFAMGTNLAIDI